MEKNWKDRQEKKQNVTDDICENANVADGWRFSLAGGKTPHGRCPTTPKRTQSKRIGKLLNYHHN